MPGKDNYFAWTHKPPSTGSLQHSNQVALQDLDVAGQKSSLSHSQTHGFLVSILMRAALPQLQYHLVIDPVFDKEEKNVLSDVKFFLQKVICYISTAKSCHSKLYVKILHPCKRALLWLQHPQIRAFKLQMPVI